MVPTSSIYFRFAVIQWHCWLGSQLQQFWRQWTQITVFHRWKESSSPNSAVEALSAERTESQDCAAGNKRWVSAATSKHVSEMVPDLVDWSEACCCSRTVKCCKDEPHCRSLWAHGRSSFALICTPLTFRSLRQRPPRNTRSVRQCPLGLSWKRLGRYIAPFALVEEPQHLQLFLFSATRWEKSFFSTRTRLLANRSHVRVVVVVAVGAPLTRSPSDLDPSWPTRWPIMWWGRAAYSFL